MSRWFKTLLLFALLIALAGLAAGALVISHTRVESSVTSGVTSQRPDGERIRNLFVQPDAVKLSRRLGGRFNASSRAAFELAGTNTGKVRFDTYQGPTSWTPVIGSTTISTGMWYHVAGVWDGSSYMRIYLNGVLDGTMITGNGPASGNSSLKIGKTSTGSYFNGLIDEARVSNAVVYTSNFTPQMHLTAGANTKGLWKFDGQSVADSSTNGNNGTLQGGATYSNDVPTGPAYHSLSLNGTTAYVQVANSSSLNITGSITVEAWFKVNSIGAYQDILARESFAVSGSGGGYELSVTNTGKVRFDTYQGPTSWTPVIGSTTISTGVWYHVAGVWDGSSYMRIYLNGVLDGTMITGNGPASGNSSLKIGRNSGGSYFNSLIDEARVSNAAIYTSNFTPQMHLTAGANTKGLWKFDGQSAADSSSNGNNGTLQSGAVYSDDVPSGDGGGGSSGGSVSQIQWLVADHLGTPRMIFDQTGNLANMKRHDYLPFGEELFAPAGGRTTAMGYAGGDGVRQQFTHKERDIETGLDYFEARYYAPIKGRFTSPDEPLAGQDPSDPQTWNLYSYTSNSPLIRVDEDGRRWFYKCDNNYCDVKWVDQNKDGSYTSPGVGYTEFVPTKEHPYLIIYSPDGYKVYRFGEDKDGGPKAFWLWTGKVEDRTEHLILAIDATRAFKALIGGAIRSYLGWRAAKAQEAAVQALLKSYHPNNDLGRAVKEVLDKGGVEKLTAIEREAAARFYEMKAAEVRGPLAEAARRLNLERARYLREGGVVPPGKIHRFK